MNIIYDVNPKITVAEFRDILVASGLGERRPVDDHARLRDMLVHANLLVTARMDGKLIGVSRAMTDFSYCCYLSDLAVIKDHQRQGIGKSLIRETHAAAGLRTSLVLLSSPAAQEYYPKIGMKAVPNGWIIPRVS